VRGTEKKGYEGGSDDEGRGDRTKWRKEKGRNYRRQVNGRG
jgi:hypothetical protein